ncbi:MAG TPA: glycosyltransferase family 1 protein [Gammaproteobacteria bacterium]|nr:glycosyltransferase family 1 protein [Gammaproteobacteria bacterium]
MINIKYIRTFYPHWGEHSGIHQFIRHLPPQKFRCEEKTVPMGCSSLMGRKFDSLFARAVKSRKMKAYRLSDAREESLTFFQSVTNKYDIIHFLDGEHGIMFLPGLLKKMRWVKSKPLLIGMFHQPPHILEELINPDIIRQLDYVSVVAPNQVDYFAQHMPRERIRAILHGIAADHFQPAESNASTDRLRCIAGGVWLRDYKAIFETARLMQGEQGVEFHLIASDLEKPADLDNVFIHRGITDEEYMRLFRESDVLFMPMEAATANNVILEGIACGLPVVSSELSSVRAYLPGKEAVLVKNNEPLVFANILRDLLKNPEKRTEMGKHALLRAKQLSWPNIAEQYDDFYTEILAGR